MDIPTGLPCSQPQMDGDMKKLTQEEKQRRIAKDCSKDNLWVLVKRGLYYRPQGAGYTSNIQEAWVLSEEEAMKHVYPHDEPVTKRQAPLPDYFNDLDELNNAVMSNRDGLRDYCMTLRRIVKRDTTPEDNELYGDINYYHATAAQRAEAYGLTMRLWEEGQ